MPKYKGILEGGREFIVTLDSAPRDAEELKSLMQEAADSLPQVKDMGTVRPSVVNTPAPEAPGVLSGIGTGIKNVASSVAALPGVLINTPSQVGQDIKALATDPLTAIPAQTERAVSFAKGMIPMRESAGDVLTGTMPSSEQVAREATEAIGGYALGKYLVPSVVGGAKKVVKSLPGSAVELNEMAAAKMRNIPENLRPTPGVVKHTYDLLDMMQAPPVAMNETLSTVQRLLAKEATLAQPDRPFMRTLQAFERKAQGGMSFKDIQNNVVDMGEKIGNVAANKGTKLTELRDLFSALHEDAANGIPAATPGGGPAPALQMKSQVWDTARMLARRDYATNDLARMIEGPGITTVGDGFTQVNTNAVASKIEDMVKLAGQDKKAALFVKSFRPGELDDIVDTLKVIGKEAPKVPAKTGAATGSSKRWIESGMGGLAGWVAGSAMGSPGIGAAVGSLSGPIASNLIAKMMMSEGGRALVRKAVTPTGTITPQSAALFSAYLQAEGQK